MDAALLTEMIDRFLSWPLPDSVCSDACVTMRGRPHRSGTNLLTADEARKMLEHVVGPLLESALAAALSERVWVPVSERLPERNIHVLLRFQNGQCDVGKWGGRRWIDPFGDDGEDFITPAHWMPLPPHSVIGACTLPSARPMPVSAARRCEKEREMTFEEWWKSHCFFEHGPKDVAQEAWQAALRHAVDLLADDASALTYQTMGQYRHAMMVTLLREASGE